MAQITVRYKPTGQIGMLPEEEFDPAVYEPVGSKGNFITDLVSDLARPFTNTAKKAGAVVETAGLAAASPEFRKKLSGKELTPQETQNLNQYKPFFEEIAKDQTVAGQTGSTLKDLAGIAAYAVPFGRGAGIAQKALLPGATTAGLFETSRPKATVGSVAGAAAGGAIVGGALYGLGKLFSGAKVGLKRAGEATIQSQYNVPRSAGRSMKLRETVQKLSDYGINNIDDIAPAAQRVTGADGTISRVVREAAGRADDVATDDLLRIAKNLVDDPSIVPGQDKKLLLFFKKGLQSLFDNTGPTPNTRANPSNVLDYIRALESKAAGITRGRSSYMIPEGDKALAHAYYSFADELSNRLFKGAGADKIAVNLAQSPQVISELSKVSPKLAAAAMKVKNVSELRSLAAPFVRGAKLAAETEAGRNLATNSVAGAVPGVGKLVQNPLNLLAVPLSTNTVNAGVGGALRSAGEKLPNMAASSALLNVGSRAGGIGGAELVQGATSAQEGAQSMVSPVQAAGQYEQGEDWAFDPNIGTYVSRDGQWAWDGQEWVPNPQASQAQGNYPTEEEFKQAILQDLMAGGKNISKLKAAMDIIHPSSATGSTSQAAMNARNLGTSGLRSLETVEQIVSEDPTVLAKQLTPGKFFSRQFDSALFNTVDSLLRLRTGAQAPETEIRRYMYSMGPTFGDDPQTIQFKIEQLRAALQDAVSNPQMNNQQSLTNPY